MCTYVHWVYLESCVRFVTLFHLCLLSAVRGVGSSASMCVGRRLQVSLYLSLTDKYALVFHYHWPLIENMGLH